MRSSCGRLQHGRIEGLRGGCGRRRSLLNPLRALSLPAPNAIIGAPSCCASYSNLEHAEEPMSSPPNFWKLSQGKDFNLAEVLDSIADGLVYVHRGTKAKGISKKSQGRNFADATVGDYFYLTHGNNFVCLLGQFTGPPNFISAKGPGWLDRPFRHIRSSKLKDSYGGPTKWWTPNENSTFVAVPPDELALFEELILTPYFDLGLADFGIPVGED